jgi:hypothetical protein
MAGSKGTRLLNATLAVLLVILTYELLAPTEMPMAMSSRTTESKARRLDPNILASTTVGKGEVKNRTQVEWPLPRWVTRSPPTTEAPVPTFTPAPLILNPPRYGYRGGGGGRPHY